MKYSEWLNIWLENYVKPTHKIRTYDLYNQTAAKKIVPYLGDYDMDELTPIIVQRYVVDMLERGNLKTGRGLSSNFGKRDYIRNSKRFTDGVFFQRGIKIEDRSCGLRRIRHGKSEHRRIKNAKQLLYRRLIRR